MKNAKLFVFLPLLIISNLIFSQTTFFKNVVIWGHKLNTHTHSYIHYGYYKAFSYLGYDTKWLDNEDDISSIDFTNTLFFTEGQVDQGIPLRNDCYYLLHNCDVNRYLGHIDPKRVMKLMVYLKPCEYGGNQKMSDCIYYNLTNRELYMPWASDLLPYEIDQNKSLLRLLVLPRSASFVGSCAGEDIYGNLPEINDFKRACSENGFNFIVMGGYGNSSGFLGINSNIAMVQETYLAPAIQGKYQCDFGYIPCRIFKNISYGKLGITNNRYVFDLFKEKIVYNADSYQLFFDACERMKTVTEQEIKQQMDFVRDNHTYLNRIDCLLKFMQLLFQEI